jgi:DNA repair protein RadC
MGGKELQDAAAPYPFADTSADNAKPDYLGHRERLRERFLKSGAEHLQDYELLELFLFGALPRRDTKPIAKALLARFGTFGEVISADISELRKVEGIGESAATTLKAVQAAAQRLLQTRVKAQDIISSWNDLVAYCTARMAYGAIEEFRVLFLDRKNKVIADEAQQRGTVDHTPVYPREVVKRALALNASAIIMVHNHPSGDPTPSRADIEMTRKVKEAAAAVHITLHDHVIVSRGGHRSFKSDGLI